MEPHWKRGFIARYKHSGISPDGLVGLAAYIENLLESERKELAEKVAALKCSEGGRDEEYYMNVAYNDGIRAVLALLKTN